MRNDKIRRGIATLAVASAAIAMVSVSPAAHAASSIGGQITASEMMSRAQYWVNNQVPYTESGATAPDPQGTQYREDCSGFVSMAWHLNTSLIVTDPAPADFTNVDGTPNTTYDHGVGAFTNLQQGDAMAYPHQHIFLFNEWTNKSTGDFTYYAESNPNDPTHGPTAARIGNDQLEGWPTSGYVGLRYNNVASGIPTGFNVALDANGSAAAGQTLSGTVNLTAMAGAQGYINTLSYTISGPNGYSTTINGGGGSTNYAQAWNTAGLANGSYTISATAAETDGQNHTYGPVNVVVATGSVSTAVIGGTAHLYGVLTDGTLATMDGDYTAGHWSNWGPLSGAGLKSVTAAVIGNTVHLYGIMNDGTLKTMDGDYTAGHWSNWGPLSGAGLKSVTAAVIGNTVHLYGIMNDGTLKTMDGDYTAGHWSNWGPLSGSGLASVSTAVMGNTVHLYGVMNDGTLKTMDGDYTAGQWSNWGPLSGAGLKSVSTAVMGNTAHLYGVMNDGTLKTMDGNYTAGQWSNWGPLSGSGLASVSTAVMGNTAHLYGVMNDGTLKTMDGDYTVGQWSNWGPLSGSGL